MWTRQQTGLSDSTDVADPQTSYRFFLRYDGSLGRTKGMLESKANPCVNINICVIVYNKCHFSIIKNRSRDANEDVMHS